MGTIYCFTFSSGKKYIGMTSQTMGRRMAVHRMCLKSSDALLYRAWRKYGDPEVSILATVEVDKLRETEREAIAVHNTMPPYGYNLASGGEGALAIAEETRQKLSKAGKGRPKSEQWRKQFSERIKGNQWWVGRKQTPEHAEKRAAANRGKKRNNDFKERMREVSLGRYMSPETRAKIAVTMKAKRAANPNWSTRKKV